MHLLRLDAQRRVVAQRGSVARGAVAVGGDRDLLARRGQVLVFEEGAVGADGRAEVLVHRLAQRGAEEGVRVALGRVEERRAGDRPREQAIHLLDHQPHVAARRAVAAAEPLAQPCGFLLEPARQLLPEARHRRLARLRGAHRLHGSEVGVLGLPAGPGRAHLPQLGLAGAPAHRRLEHVAQEVVGHRGGRGERGAVELLELVEERVLLLAPGLEPGERVVGQPPVVGIGAPLDGGGVGEVPEVGLHVGVGDGGRAGVASGGRGGRGWRLGRGGRRRGGRLRGRGRRGGGGRARHPGEGGERCDRREAHDATPVHGRALSQLRAPRGRNRRHARRRPHTCDRPHTWDRTRAPIRSRSRCRSGRRRQSSSV